MSFGRARVVPLAVGFAALLASCGGSDQAAPITTGPSSSTAAVTSAQWRDALDEDCVGLNREFDDLVDAAPANRRAAVSYADRIDEFAGRMVDVVESAGPAPGDDRRQAVRLQALLDDLAGATDQLRSASADGDAEAARDATEEIEAIGSGLNSVAERLGVESCGGF